jgi:hypothetical protein
LIKILKYLKKKREDKRKNERTISKNKNYRRKSNKRKRIKFCRINPRNSSNKFLTNFISKKRISNLSKNKMKNYEKKSNYYENENRQLKKKENQNKLYTYYCVF